MIHVACIVTQNHVGHSLTMFGSIHEIRKGDCHLHVLIVDGNPQDNILNMKNVTLYSLQDLYDNQKFGMKFRILSSRYAESTPNRKLRISKYDYLRWALKPVFCDLLLEKHNKIFFCDSDLYFYSDFRFLEEQSNGKSICLSPHWRNIYKDSTNEWKYNYKHGLYNGGFFIVTRKGRKILEWWTEMCILECSAEEDRIVYVDQEYLNVVPLYFNDVFIIKHQGCNVAAWNRLYLKRHVTEDGQVLVNGQKIIFIHYSPVTIETISDSRDYLLSRHFKQYRHALLNTKIELTRQNLDRFVNNRMGVGLYEVI